MKEENLEKKVKELEKRLETLENLVAKLDDKLQLIFSQNRPLT